MRDHGFTAASAVGLDALWHLYGAHCDSSPHGNAVVMGNGARCCFDYHTEDCMKDP